MDAMSRCARHIRRYMLPLAVLLLGAGLWRGMVPVPGEPIRGLPRARGIAAGPDGALYLAAPDDCRVWRVREGRGAEVVAGTGKSGDRGDGGPAARAELDHPVDLVLDRHGRLFIADSSNACIRKVDRRGIITTVAGGKGLSEPADGMPAKRASAYAWSVAVDARGDLFILRPFGCTVWRMDPNGTLSRVAGSSLGSGGPAHETQLHDDGVPARQALLHDPTDIALGSRGDLYIADWNADRVCRVDPAGTLTTVAGNGHQGNSGDGGPAADASLSRPADLAADAAGNLYIVGTDPSPVRKVDARGKITTVTVVGDGSDPENCHPFTLATDLAGDLYINYSLNWAGSQVRRVDRTGAVHLVTAGPRLRR